MAFRLPPMHALEAFEAAARQQSFVKAADELCVTQSAVSHRIRQLEDDLGVRLFLRLNRNIVLTPPGERYLAGIRAALADIERATHAIARSVRHELRVSVAPAIGSKWLVSRLADFQRQHPDIDLILSTSTQLGIIRSGEVDVGVRYGHGKWPGLPAFKMSDEVLVTVCSPDYPARVGGLDEPRHLARASLLRHPILPWRPWLQAAGLDWPEPAGGVRFDDAVMMIEAAAAGNGVALSPRRLVEPHLAAGSLIQAFAIEAIDHGYHVLLSPDAQARPWVMGFVNWLLAAARPLPPENDSRAA
ncbi:MAG TPA: transcriptional regulator GcvA [Candidatus Accumulibacter phosphatis]|nr:MAG: Gcv operon activator [Candidatus Accumulibacter sp. SK-11]HCV14132.1 LysR family transcriptional regulator [Accumulibacter sp.]HRL77237.1 transcriptional regulator GcvA [Candidatus Accumulibacter phosphatis]HRQ95682.1 transcriptional regulator GcvA [Candidatus Accumulibacter phosphatis]